MTPAKVENYAGGVYITCPCGQRFSPNNVYRRPRREQYGLRWVITVCDTCRRQVAVVEAGGGQYAKPPLLAGDVARSVRV